ncbi:NUDIX hydrolase [Brachybacterium sp. FME24]|uniref:NUDIX domain-containing protein n=1 Tax=Brachybacterium sp. FME24 TaxID=2742605 RepID=UPI0018662272|nr:NUDIX hydrolase [Brachybacterium sp. FME24]
MLPKAEYLASLPSKRVIASALFVDAGGRALCVEPTYKETWHLPGGTVEQGESPSEGCVRECREELGVPVVLGRLLAVGHIGPSLDDPVGALAFIYEASLGGLSLSGLRLQASEIHSVAWLRDELLRDRLSELAHRFVLSGMEAVRTGRLVEIDRLEL